MRQKILCVLLSAGLALALLAGCAGNDAGAGDEGARDSVIVAMSSGSEPEAGFDPAYGWGAGEHMHEPLIQSTLTVTNEDLTIGYDLATDLQVSVDGLTWTVAIRKDAAFTDGEPLTAEDVAFTYNTVKALSTVNDFTMLEQAVAVDEYTVAFHMNRPYAIWPYSMAVVGIVPAHAYGPEYGQQPVGSGRYVLQQWDKGQQAIFEANPDYYGDPPAIRRLTVLFMEEDAAFTAARAGQVDITYTSAPYARQAVEGYSLLAVETVDNRGISLPTIPFDGEKGNDVTCDPAVRMALNLGVSRTDLIDHVLEGYGRPAYSVCDKMPWFHPDGSTAPYDPKGAVDLLEEAGWLDGSDGVRERDEVRAELNILYPSGDSVRQAIAAEVAGQLRELGLDASFEGVGWDEAYDRANREPFVWGYGSHTPMELYNLYRSDPETGMTGFTFYRNDTVDAYIDAAMSAATLEDSYFLWQQAQWDGETGILTNVPWLWLANIDHLFWVRDGLKVAEQKLHPHGHGWSIVNNVDRWTWQ